MKSIDKPDLNDNREYDYTNHYEDEKKEYHLIAKFIKPGSKVIDLGCGNGSLMQLLEKERNAVVEGIELSLSGVEVCKKKGLNVSQKRIDEELDYEDDSFDYSVCNVTLQMVLYPEVLLKEMKRIAKYQVLAFPNFAFYKNRIDLLLNGRMPQPMLFDYKWYTTGHIHQLSIKDFYQLISEIGGLEVVGNSFVRPANPIKNKLMELFPNLFQPTPLFLLKKTGD